VFRAWDTRLDREVALKILPAPPGTPATSTIIQEGRLLARVRHPNVVTIHGAEQIGDRIGLWMELVQGQTLDQLIRSGAVFRSADVIRIGVELCQAVSAEHAAGLLHRDIKAQNVMRAHDGRVVLMDFGTGKELDDSSSSDLTGTPLYLAPEVLAGGRVVRFPPCPTFPRACATASSQSPSCSRPATGRSWPLPHRL
jgi:serine/threonine protein kinase